MASRLSLIHIWLMPEPEPHVPGEGSVLRPYFLPILVGGLEHIPFIIHILIRPIHI